MGSITDDKWTKISLDLTDAPDNFENWQNLAKISSQNLNKLSKEPELERFRVSYNQLLFRYPNLEQYWINYSKLEFKLGFTDNSLRIYEQSLTVLPSSLLIWTEYLKFLTHKIGLPYDELIKYYQRAEMKVGTHYHSYEFWEQYLNFEEKFNGRSIYYFNLFKKVIEIPTYHYAELFNKFLKEIEDLDNKTVHKIINKSELSKKFKLELRPNEHFSKEALSDLKIKLKKIYTDTYITTQFRSYEIFRYEGGIKFEYFVPNLYKSYQELTNWEQYLDFVELTATSTFQDIENIYERCLISCCSYPQFWLKFANFYLKNQQFESAKNLLNKSIVYLNETNSIEIYKKLINIELKLRNYYKAKDITIMLIEYSKEVNVELYFKLVDIIYLLNFKKLDKFKTFFKDLINHESHPIEIQNALLIYLFNNYKSPQIHSLNFLNELNLDGQFNQFLNFNMLKLNMMLTNSQISEVSEEFQKISKQFTDSKDQNKLYQWYDTYLSYIEQDVTKLYMLNVELNE
ncbi:hypothetical protein WICMUC_003315 [Wickerhamomyces mucosus]|uniref:Suppressor of forked domain-containing protein n=1 Tax=Wickerhamomyces mucosus TaxID=1378264 RepID=A0A9P8PLZ6_9ASCO|nr:hypothetical protein WICMUC_003315 [Wickerhamomyces mucosus]